jgi:hypothetical protein
MPSLIMLSVMAPVTRLYNETRRFELNFQMATNLYLYLVSLRDAPTHGAAPISWLAAMPSLLRLQRLA